LSSGPLSFRQIALDEASKIAEIDRSERVTLGYVVRDGRLVSEPVDWNIPRWTVDGHRDFNLETRIARLRERIESGDVAMGAFDDGLLVAYAVLHPGLTQGMAQLAELFVSRVHRKLGIARRLVERLIERARMEGATRLYVSSAPSESAVGFYLSQGFRLTPEPDPDLYRLEPDDIHMVRNL
jgi:GNAT superfamily N-acetyltransferase